MSTRLTKHKMCTKGSFIFLNHVHSYMELPHSVFVKHTLKHAQPTGFLIIFIVTQHHITSRHWDHFQPCYVAFQSGRHISKPTHPDEDMGNVKESPVKKPRGRSRSPSRSPSRRTKSPSRAKKSPSRSGKSPVRSSRSPPRSAKTLKAQSVENSASATSQTTATKRSVSRRQSKSPTRQSQRVMQRVEVVSTI